MLDGLAKSRLRLFSSNNGAPGEQTAKGETRKAMDDLWKVALGMPLLGHKAEIGGLSEDVDCKVTRRMGEEERNPSPWGVEGIHVRWTFYRSSYALPLSTLCLSSAQWKYPDPRYRYIPLENRRHLLC